MSVPLTFITPDGEARQVSAQLGATLMQAAKAACVPGVEADCGGAMVCGTCHVIVAPEWAQRLQPACEMELMILEGVPEPHPGARLSCQIRVEPALAGMALQVPATQR